jgi:hypothetical protein
MDACFLRFMVCRLQLGAAWLLEKIPVPVALT